MIKVEGCLLDATESSVSVMSLYYLVSHQHMTSCSDERLTADKIVLSYLYNIKVCVCVGGFGCVRVYLFVYVYEGRCICVCVYLCWVKCARVCVFLCG